MIPDRDSDIKPRFHKSRTHSQKHVEDGQVYCLIVLGPFLNEVVLIGV